MRPEGEIPDRGQGVEGGQLARILHKKKGRPPRQKPQNDGTGEEKNFRGKVKRERKNVFTVNH